MLYLYSSPEDIIVADLGCGEAKIAQSVKQKVFSFDLIAKNDFVVAAEISKVKHYLILKQLFIFFLLVSSLIKDVKDLC